MNLFSNRLDKLIDTVTSMNESYITMSANFKNLEISYDKFVDLTDKKLDKVFEENEDIRRRLTSIEGSFDSVIRSSTKEAIINLAREKYKQVDQIPDDTNEVGKLINKDNTSDNNI